MPNRRRREESKYIAQSRLLAASMRELRARAGMTQEAVAREADVSLNTVRNVESGQCVEPGYFTVLAIAQVLGADVGRVSPG